MTPVRFPSGEQTSQPGQGRRLSVVLCLGVSGLLLFGLYRSLDLAAIAAALSGSRPGWLLVSLGLIAPITVLMALRFTWIAPADSVPSLMEGVRLTLVANAANMLLPAKSGDLVKSYFVSRRGGTAAGVSIAVVVYERISDLFGLITCCLLGLSMSPRVAGFVPLAVWLLLSGVGAVCLALLSSDRVTKLLFGAIQRLLSGPRFAKVRAMSLGWPDLHRGLQGRRAVILLFSVFIWAVQLTQFWMFAMALARPVPFTVIFSLCSLAMFAGLVPFTFAGIGARDVALVVLLSPYMTPEGAAALGILAMSRSILPSLAALPIMQPYLAGMFGEGRRAPS